MFLLEVVVQSRPALFQSENLNDDRKPLDGFIVD